MRAYRSQQGFKTIGQFPDQRCLKATILVGAKPQFSWPIPSSGWVFFLARISGDVKGTPGHASRAMVSLGHGLSSYTATSTGPAKVRVRVGRSGVVWSV